MEVTIFGTWTHFKTYNYLSFRTIHCWIAKYWTSQNLDFLLERILPVNPIKVHTRNTWTQMYFTAISVISSEVKDKQQPRLIAPYIQFGLSKRIIRPEITTVPCQKSSQIINSLKGKKFSTIWWTFKFSII